MQISDLPFSEIPHQSRLFLEYQNDPLSLKRFYPNAVASASEIRSFVPDVLASYHTSRDELCKALTDINTRAGAAAKTFENIERLREPSCVAVVTGQQAGLFTGPLYTIYKALSAVKQAELLGQQGIAAVPVFWAATEDHDFDEVSQAFSLGKAGELITSKYLAGERFDGRPVGNVLLDETIPNVVGELFENIGQTEFTADLRKTLASAWADGQRFGDAFLRTLAAILADTGLIFIDPMHPGIKKLSSPIYVNAIKRADEIVAAIRERGLQLEAEGFHSQVLVDEDYFPFFWHDSDGRRNALRKLSEGVYRVKGVNREVSHSELLEIAANEPHNLSPGVMLRPVVQDYLLPTVCYFGGGAEIAYFAQNSEAYRLLNRPITPILHRQSFTIVEPKQRKILDKFALSLIDLFTGVEQITLALAARNVSPDVASLFGSVEERVNTELNRLDRRLTEIDQTVAANFAKRRQKMIYHIGAIRKKTLLAVVRKDEIVSRQIANLFTAIVPNGELQERSLNVVTFLNRFGPNFIDWLYRSIDLDDKDHRIIDL
ncbi:MAG: bacillithiol biosynthesis cysteine-adding enzyme BshC [Pyrinomonadaceae bacterium]